MRKRFRSARKLFAWVSETMFRKAPWAALARGGRREGKGDMGTAAEEKGRRGLAVAGAKGRVTWERRQRRTGGVGSRWQARREGNGMKMGRANCPLSHLRCQLSRGASLFGGRFVRGCKLPSQSCFACQLSHGASLFGGIFVGFYIGSSRTPTPTH